MSITVFTLLSLIMITFDVAIIVATFAERKAHTFSLVGCVIASISVNVSYLFTLLIDSYTNASLCHSWYFISIDVLLMFALTYVQNIAVSRKKRKSSRHGIFLKLLNVLVLTDIVILLTNPFKEIAIHFKSISSAFTRWEFVPYLPFNLHLGLCYTIIFLIIVHLLVAIKTNNKIYRNRFYFILLGILAIVAMNALFLFVFQGTSVDFSILFYSVICYVFFLTNHHYNRKGLVDIAGQMVIDQLNIPLILFDIDGSFIQNNPSAGFLTKDLLEEGSFSSQNFVDRWNISSHFNSFDQDVSFQWEYDTQDSSTIYRVDYVVLKAKNGDAVGRVFMFTEYSLDIDLLTGFHTEFSFKKLLDIETKDLKYPVGVAICDINRLSEINTQHGKETGDIAIKYLADAIREFTPAGSYYVRLNDAVLMFVCPDTTISAMRSYIDSIEKRLDSHRDFPAALKMQNAITLATEAFPDIDFAIKSSVKSMKAKKMMDVNSAHSSLLDSIAQILQESDPTTNEHVKRTQIMGEKLGRRLGLSDYDLSNLALLCLLHDIGKLGIPLEILNKPAKLSNEEWDVMKSHTDKGYKIAKASEELEDIADLILHHHECWNGRGYPDGLAGDAIPLLSRIIAVVDTYDAMTNDRPYRKALSNAHACKELLRCAGSQFDPYIVNQFIEMLSDMDLYAEETATADESSETITPMGLKNENITENANCSIVKYTKYVLGKQERIISIDENFESMTGYSKEDLETYNLTQHDLIFPEDLKSYIAMVTMEINKNHEAFIEHRLRRKDGSSRRVLCDGREFFDPVSREPRVQIIATDIALSEAVREIVDKEKDSQRRSHKLWEDSVRKDPLTGILNRIAFQSDVSLNLLNGERIVVLMMCDIDFFKQYNDSHGHLNGDELLIHFAHTLKSAVPNGLAARMGGDEFAAMMLFDRTVSTEAITKEVQIIWEHICNQMQIYENEVTVSMGIAISTGDNETFDNLYKTADTALYSAKENGRNDFVVVDERR